MIRTALFSLALALTPVAVLAQAGPPPPDAAGATAPTAQQMAAMQQMRAQSQQIRLQTRSRMLAALTPQHRAAVANIAGQLVLAVNPDPRTAALSLDALLSPAEKQSILAINSAEHANMRALMEQHRAAMESTLTADQRAQMAQRQAKMEAFRQSHPRPAEAADPGAIVLRTLGSFGGPGGPGMHGHDW